MEKLNIAEILKDCPKGMELDCTMCDNVYLDEVTPNMIKCFTKDNVYNTIYFNHDGTYLTAQNAKCVIFPKGKTTWEGFQRPFKDGDVVISNYGDIHLLRTEDSSYCAYRNSFIKKFDHTITTGVSVARLATEKEKEKLFKAIKDNGYKWNAETKTLEKLIEPKFKVGDWVEFKYYERKPEKVIRIENNVYWLSSGATVMFQDESAWDLTTKKFDITTLKPFKSRVLVRNVGNWEPAFWGYYSKEYAYPFVVVGGGSYSQCVPYEGNEHLLGTKNDCDEYFKTW